MKQFNKFELAAIKRTAQNVFPTISKINKLKEKYSKLTAEIENLQQIVDTFENPIKAMTGGFGTTDIMERVVEDTGKVDKNGNPIKTTKFNFIYDTIVPELPAEEECAAQEVLYARADVVEEDINVAPTSSPIESTVD